MIHAEIADRERRVADIGWPQSTGPGSIGEFASLASDFCDLQVIWIANDGCYDAVLDSHGDADIDLAVVLNRLARPTGV